ncbi:hypothetical protein ACRCUN_04655 [Mycobacterium sp. LTG2003]
MASTDTTDLLAPGRPAVDTFAEYVWACRLLGYHHQDLTGHARQLHEWYDTEQGLNLRTIDTECTALTAAAASAEPALQLQDSQIRVLSESWLGSGGRASSDFLQRNGGAARHAVAALRAAASTLAQLSDELRQAVERKVTLTLQIEGRHSAQRGTWLGAARTVTTGLGDRSIASELIDQQVKPFVDNEIAGEWLAAMRSSTTAVADAYDAALSALRSGPVPVFEIPGALGPAWAPAAAARDAAPRSVGIASAPTVPAGFTPGLGGAPSWSPPPTLSAATPPVSPADVPASVPPPAPVEPVTPPGLGQTLGAGLPGAGGGLPDMGAGLTGTGQQLADLFGGLIGSAAEGLPGEDPLGGEPPDLDDEVAEDAEDPEIDDEPDEDDEGEEDPEDAEDPEIDDEPDEDDEGEEDPEDAEDAEDEPVEEVEDAPVGPQEAESVDPPQDPPEPVSTAPPLAEPPAQPLATPAAETPCEIAADELPQVGQ